VAAHVKTVAVVQARTASTRLPDKVLKPILGTPMIEVVLERLRRARGVDEIVLATSDTPADDRLAAHVHKLGVTVFRGSERDVLDRYHAAAKLARADIVVRVTGDCPLVDPELVDAAVSSFKSANAFSSGSTTLENVRAELPVGLQPQ